MAGGNFSGVLRHLYQTAFVMSALGLACVVQAQSADDHAAMHEHHHHHEHAMEAPGKVLRSTADYQVARVSMVRQDGGAVSFPKELDDGRPVILNFIYTSCTAICPVTTQIFSEVQQKLGSDAAKVHIVSISIDPEFDTPKRLADYARKYKAGNQWQFYTGSLAASIALQKSFDAYRGDKMNHIPLTLLRPAPGKPWVRLEGLASPDDVIGEYRKFEQSN